MKQLKQCARPLRAPCGRPCRRALHVNALHKALRQPSAGPITDPADVVYECLTLLRRPDVQSLVPFFPAGSFDPSVRRVAIDVGGQAVEEAGPLACCHTVMDTAARRVLPGHLLRRCRVLSSVVLGDRCQQRVALTACTGEEAVFVWRLRRVTHGSGPAPATGLDSGSDSGSGSREGLEAAAPTPYEGQCQEKTDTRPHTQSSDINDGLGGHNSAEVAGGAGQLRGSAEDGGSGASSSWSRMAGSGTAGRAAEDRRRDQGTGLAASTSRPAAPSGPASATTHPNASQTSPSDSHRWLPSPSGSARSWSESESDSESGSPLGSRDPNSPTLTAWIVESIARDDSHDEDELPQPGPAGGGPHPRCPPELVVKAQLAALRRGDTVGAASFNLWSRSTSGGWDLHLSAFRALLRQPAYAPLLEAARAGAELGPSALPSPRRMLQEVRLVGGRAARAGGSGGGGGAAAEAPSSSVMVYQLGMQANGCWVVEAIRAV